MADDEHLEYPRWEHHDDFQSEIVGSVDERRALFSRWEDGKGTPKAPARAPLVRKQDVPAAQVPAAEPQFKVYDITTDNEIPLTQERLDELLTAEGCMSILWPAIRRDDEARDPANADPIFPPETAEAISKVREKLEGTVAAEAQSGTEEVSVEETEPASDEPAKRKPGRPRKNPEPTT